MLKLMIDRLARECCRWASDPWTLILTLWVVVLLATAATALVLLVRG
jgi:hypothetical protein